MRKRCFKCRELKPLSMFYAHPMMADGHLGKCKECAKRDVRENRATKVDYFRAYDRVRYYDNGRRGEASVEACRKGKRNWDDKNRDKKRAHVMVHRAVLSGVLKRPSQCTKCHKRCKPHGHHDDYSKPLEVRWLCSACHRAWHRKYDEQETREQLKNARKSA